MSGMLFVTSCSQDELVNEAPNADFVNATFTISTADGMGSRTIGDGSIADVVACAVFDANGNEMTELRNNTLPVSDKKAKYQIRVAKGQAYRVAFFAYNNAAAAYDLTNFKSIKINGNQASNIEERDAFTNYIDITAEETANGEIIKPVTLYRPFAQLNLGIDNTELENARKAGVVVANTKITVSNVYNAFNAFDNDIADDAVAGSMTFGLNAIPSETLVANGNPYTWLAMNYLLVGNQGQEKSLTDVEFVWETADGKTNNPTTHFVNIPVQRKWRTNIIGHLLTNPATFNIEIDNSFDNEYNEEIETTVTNVVTSAAELQAAIDAAPVGQTLIKLGHEIAGNITVHQKKDVEILIDGQNNNFVGQIFVSGGSNFGLEGLSIENVNFHIVEFGSSKDIINLGKSDDSSDRYVHNINLTNCTFDATIAGPIDIVAVRAYQSKDLTFVNCTVSNKLHSFIQATGCNDVKIEQATVNSKRGINISNAQNVYVANSTFSNAADKYGIRLGAQDQVRTWKIVNTTIDAFVPVVVRNENNHANPYVNLVFEGTNNFTKHGEYEVAVAHNEYDTVGETLNAIAGATVTGADASWTIFK